MNEETLFNEALAKHAKQRKQVAQVYGDCAMQLLRDAESGGRANAKTLANKPLGPLARVLLKTTWYLRRVDSNH
jgi:hypothetical protein